MVKVLTKKQKMALRRLLLEMAPDETWLTPKRVKKKGG